MNDRLIIMVTGGREFSDKEAVAIALEPYANVGNILLSGGARGADALCERFWRGRELPLVVMPAPWQRMGRPAGPARSHAMLAGNSIAPYAILKPDVLVAFPGGIGTRRAVERAKKLNIPVTYG